MEKALHWFEGGRREERIFWVHGPAGVGKSAIIQALAITAARSGRLGGSAFISNLRNPDISRRILPTISYDLTLKDPAYRAYVEGVMSENPEMLERGPILEQFRLLIAEPFVQGRVQLEAAPWLIAIDALDEIGDDCGQTLLGCITELTIQHPTVPLLWMISSQLEPRLLLQPKLQIPLLTAEISSDVDRTNQSVEIYLQGQFNKIRQIHHLKLQWPWPSYHELLRVLVIASGSLAFAIVAARFTDDPWISDPPLQLERLISHPTMNPYTEFPTLPALDSLFFVILGRIPVNVYCETTRMLLAVRCLQDHESVDAKLDTLIVICNVLGITEHDAYIGLQHLHPIFRIPAPEDAASQNLEFHHLSFMEFIQDPTRSRDYNVVEDSVYTRLRERFSVILQQNGTAGKDS